MKAKVNMNGKLYAAIHPDEIIEAIKKDLKVLVHPDQIVIDNPMKELGEYKILIEFGHGLEAELNVFVSEK